MLVIQSTKKIAQNMNELMHTSAIAPPIVIQPPLTMLQIVSKTDSCKNGENNAPRAVAFHERGNCKEGVET